jgi:type I site-specific restriction-modification system R (restriction) subunit
MTHPQMKNPTLVVVTDRNDLDGQLHGMFDMAAEVLGEKPGQADSRTALREQLNQRPSGGIVFTTIQKFVPGEDGRHENRIRRFSESRVKRTLSHFLAKSPSFVATVFTGAALVFTGTAGAGCAGGFSWAFS